jgi:hypothetical protein
MEDGKWLDTDTGEITDYAPKEEQPGLKFTEEGKQKASDVYLDDKYYNQYGKVSPINIIFLDNMNQICAMDPEQAKTFIIDTIEQFNRTYGGDNSYDYISAEYINKMKLNFSKMRSIDKIMEYLTNTYFKGIGMSNSRSKSRSAGIDDSNIITIDISDKAMLDKILVGLNALAKFK